MAGTHGLLAFWIGGAGATPAAEQGAVRGMLAPWIGGAGATPAAEQGAVRGMLAPWMGGAGAVPGQVEPPTPPILGGGGRYPVPPDLRAGFRRRLLAEDELMLLMAAQIAGAGLLH